MNASHGVIKAALLGGLLLGFTAGCNFPRTARGFELGQDREETPFPSGAGEAPDEGYASDLDHLWGGVGFVLRWDEPTPLGLRFEGELTGCPSGPYDVYARVHGDLGGGILLDEAGSSADVDTSEAMWPVPLVDAPIIVVSARVDMGGSINDPECACTIQQSIELAFELDFATGNGWVRDATGVGQSASCDCPGLSQSVPLIEFYFPRDILVTLEGIDITCPSNPGGQE